MIYQTETGGTVTAIETNTLNENNLGTDVLTQCPTHHQEIKVEDKKIYDDVEHEPTAFTLDVEELTIVVGDSHKFIITQQDLTKNLPVLVWECTKDTDAETGKSFDVCFVNNNILRAMNIGTSTVTAYDVTDPENLKTATVTVTVVDRLPEAEVEEGNDLEGGDNGNNNGGNS